MILIVFVYDAEADAGENGWKKGSLWRVVMRVTSALNWSNDERKDVIIGDATDYCSLDTMERHWSEVVEYWFLLVNAAVVINNSRRTVER